MVCGIARLRVGCDGLFRKIVCHAGRETYHLATVAVQPTMPRIHLKACMMELAAVEHRCSGKRYIDNRRVNE